MVDEGKDFVIHYTPDITEVLAGIKEIQTLNAEMAATLGEDFTKAINIVGASTKSITKSLVNGEKLPTGEFEKINQTITKTTTLIQAANGELFNFVQTVKQLDKAGAEPQIITSLSPASASIQKAANAANELNNQVSQLGTNLTSVTDINKKFSTQLKDLGEVSSIVGQNINKISDKKVTIDGKDAVASVKDLGTVVQTTNGKFLQINETITRLPSGLQTVSRSVADVTGKFKDTAVTQLQSAKSAQTFGDAIKQLGSRALLTIPIWIALRSAITGVFTGIRDGFKNLVDFDLSLQKVRRNLQGTPAEIDAQFKQLSSSITKLSLDTGVSTDKIAEAVKQFATIGFSFQDSLQGGIDATKLSIVLFGDASETAQSFARSLKILTDSTAGAVPVQEQLARAFALTSELEKSNQFDINEVNESLIRFAPTAKAAGISMENTLRLLAALGTAGLTGSRGGTLLSSTVNQLRKNLNLLAGTLGVSVNPQFDDTFTVLQKVLTKAAELGKQDKLGARQVEALSTVFGGEKGTKTINALITAVGTLKNNLNISADADRFNSDVQKVLQTPSGLAKQLGNSLKEAGKAFASSLVNGKDFVSVLQSLNNTVQAITPALSSFATALRTIFQNIGLIAATAFVLNFQKVLTVGAFFGSTFARLQVFVLAQGALLGQILANGVSTGFVKRFVPQIIGLLGARLVAGLASVAAFLFNPLVAGALIAAKLAADFFTNEFIKGIEKKNAAAQGAFTNLVQGLKGQLASSDLKKLITDLLSGAVKLEPGVDKQKVILALRKVQRDIFAKEKIKVQVEADKNNNSFLTTKEQQDVSKSIIKDQLERLKSQGASTAELLKQESLLNKQFNIFEDEGSILDRQLATQRALTEEKRLQNRLGNDSIKLFEIAQTQGTQTAKNIGDVLAGNTDFDTFFRRGGQDLEIFKKEFADVFKQQQAQQFFQGNRVAGLPDLRGGSNIPIQEQILQNGLPTGFNAGAQRANAIAQGTTTPEIRADILNRIDATIKVNVEGLSFRDAVKAMKAELARDLTNPESDLSKQIDIHNEQH